MQTLLITLSGAMITAAAIAFSLIMFAMQVNVERMPYGLFRKFSSDIKLLVYFLIIFILAITIGILSLVIETLGVTIAILVMFWSITFILLILITAYKRALKLISPIEQLQIVVSGTRANLNAWAKAAKRFGALHEIKAGKNSQKDQLDFNHDIGRLTYFQQIPSWTNRAQQAMQYAFALAKNHATKSDYEASQAALNAVIYINTYYIKAKGRTFFPEIPLVNNPLSNDAFINETLEHLRKYVQISVLRHDEQQILQAFNAIKALSMVYSTIDYSVKVDTKYHANLAITYFLQAIEFLMPYKMVEVIIGSFRLVAQVCLYFIDQGNIRDVTTSCDKIALISSVYTIEKTLRSATYIGIEKLAEITLYLLKAKTEDVKFVLDNIRSNIAFIAKTLLEINDYERSDLHSYYLSFYYSATNNQALSYRLTELANAILEAAPTDAHAKTVISHIEQWADNLFLSQKELLLLAIAKKSSFVFDLICWIIQVTKILMAVATADCCDSYDSKELKQHAQLLINIFSFIPNSEDAVVFVENYQLADELFSVAVAANKYKHDEIAFDVRDLILFWIGMAGKYSTRWANLEKKCYILACLNIILKLEDSILLKDISEKIDKGELFDGETRRHASAEIKKKIEEKANFNPSLSEIDNTIKEIDEKKLETLLIKLAESLI